MNFSRLYSPYQVVGQVKNRQPTVKADGLNVYARDQHVRADLVGVNLERIPEGTPRLEIGRE